MWETIKSGEGTVSIWEQHEYSSYRVINLLSVAGKVYGSILTERLMEVTEWKLNEEQGVFRKGRGSVDQIFAMKRLVEEYLGKDRKLYVPGKVYGRILTERLMEVTEGKVDEVQGVFSKGRGCVDQIFAMKRLVDEYLGKDKKLYGAFMDLEKAYDSVNRDITSLK